MKKIFRVFALAAACAALFSCVDKPEFKKVPFVTMYKKSATVLETQEGTVFSIPVKLYDFTGDESIVAYKVVGGTATSGVDYKLEDISGVLDFKGGVDSLNIKVQVIGQPGTFTGDLNVKFALQSATDGVTIGKYSTFTLNIKDADHPLTELFGAYDMASICYENGTGLIYPKWTINISQYEGYADRVWIDNPTYFTVAYASYTKSSPIYGVVSSDKKTITIPLPQKTTGSLSAFGLDNVYVFAHEGFNGGEGKYITADTKVVFKLQEDGSWVTSDCFGAGHPDDLADYPELFYEYCVNYASYSSSYPTYFVKK